MPIWRYFLCQIFIRVLLDGDNSLIELILLIHEGRFALLGMQVTVIITWLAVMASIVEGDGQGSIFCHNE